MHRTRRHRPGGRARLAIVLGLAVALVFGQWTVAQPASAATPSAATAFATASAKAKANAKANCATVAAQRRVQPADDIECKDLAWPYPFDTLEECNAEGQIIVDNNPAVPVWYCWYNGDGTWTLHIIACRYVDGVDEAETWINGNSGLYLDVSNQSTSNGAAVHQWSYTGAENQWWLRVRGSDDYYKVINVNSGLCLGVSGASKGNGTQIVQWACNGSRDQDWSYNYAGTQVDGWPVYHVVDRNSGKCLGIIGGSTAVGGNAVQWDCNGHPDQNWH